jgi:hypothetical protein
LWFLPLKARNSKQNPFHNFKVLSPNEIKVPLPLKWQMSLLKKIIFSVFVIVSLVLAVWAYKALQQNKKPSIEVLGVMPDSCILYCSTKNFTDLSIKLNSQNLIFNRWKVLEEVDLLSETIDLYDSLIYNNELIKSIIDDNMIHLAMYKTNSGLHWMVGFSLKELKQEAELLQLLEKVLVKNGNNTFTFKTNKLKFQQGVGLISDSEELLERAFANGAKLNANKTFMEQLEGIGRNETMRLYVNEELFQKNAESSPFRISKLLDAKQVIANVKFNPNEIIINGNYDPSDEFLQKVIASQSATDMELYEQLPFGTNYFKALAVNSPEKFQAVMETAKGNLEFWNAVNEKALYKVNNEFYGCIDDHIIEFNSFIYKSLAIQINDTIKIVEVLKHLSGSDTVHNGVRVYDLKPDLVQNAFGGLFDMNAMNAFVWNDVLYLTSQMNAAMEIIAAVQNNSTMKSNEVFMDYVSDNLNEPCSYMYYIAPNMNKTLSRQFFTSYTEEYKDLFDNLSDANLMVAKKGSVLKFRMQVNYLSPSSGNIPNLLWQCALDSGSTQQPYVFVNHSTKENEIVIQDGANQLYLINSTGKILWKKKINETVRSPIYTVDIFRNKKYQMLFNTDNYLHLLDRNGKYVDGYPIKLSSPATNAISLVDYEGKGDVRIFLACKNHLIYSYTLYGVRSEGFKLYKTDATVKLPIRFVRVGESDYLITIDESGIIHAFSRKGDGRIGFKNRAVEHCQDFTLVATNTINRTFLYYVDERNNLINRVSFADKKDVVKLKADLTDARIAFQDVNGDQTPDFTAQLFNGLYAYDINGTLLYDNPKLNGTSKVFVNSFDSRKLYYGYDGAKRSIVMSSNAGMQVQELQSSALPGVFDLFKDDKRYMVYVHDGKLMCSQVK